ncbi:MAG: SctK family type III secretion system sorting platform protein [Desulfobacteraceae bacterium]|jgi:hypothetical protein
MPDNIMQRIIRGDDPLAALIHQFNVFPTRYMHPSWWENVMDFPAAVGRCLENKRSEKHLAAYLLNSIGHKYCYQFQDVAHRIVLLDRHILKRLVYTLGLTLNSRRIKAVVEGRKARSLKKDLGENAYLFAIKRATLFGSHTWFWDVAGDAPELTREQVLQDGRICIQICLSDAPEAMTKRFELKFANTVCWDFSENGQSKDRNRAWSLVRKVLFQEAGPQWKNLFNS